MEIPDGYVGLIFPRSSVTNKQLLLKNSVGVIDAGYRGEICFRFYKTYNTFTTVLDFIKTFFNKSYKSNIRYNVGDRIGQLMILQRPQIELEEVSDLNVTIRGEGGYGSTGN